MDKVSESLKVSLEKYHTDALHEMAETLALAPNRLPARKNWLVTELSKAIPKTAHSSEYIQALSASERGLLALVIDLGGVATVPEVARPLLLAGLTHIKDEPETAGQPMLKDVVLGLMRKGLLVNLTDPRGGATMRSWSQYHRFGVAPEVQKVLPKSLLSTPRVHPSAPWIAEKTPPVVLGDTLNHFMRQLFFAWAELRRQPARQLKSGGMGKRDMRRLTQILSLDEETELDRVETLHVMLVALNLVTENGAEIAAVDNSAATLFWNAAPVRQLHDLGRAYAKLSHPLPGAEGRAELYDYLQGYGHRALSAIRGEVYAGIGPLVTYGWVSFPFFVSFLTSGRPGTLLLGDDSLTFILDSLRWYGLNYRADVENTIEQLETNLVHAVLVELAYMGIVELGYPEVEATVMAGLSATPLALRVTPVVRAYYEDRSGAEGTPEQKWQVILQPDFQLLAMGPVPLRVLSNLQQVAGHEKVGESVIAYRITRDSIYEAFQRGETVASIIGYLEEATQQSIPQNVSRSVEEWSHQHERIVLRRQVRLVQVDAAERLDALLEDDEMRRLLHRLGPRVAWVRPGDAAKLEARLVKQQLLTAHSGKAEEDLPNSLSWRDGDLASRTPLPSLYVTGTLNRIAEAHDGRWCITPKSVQTAVLVGTGPLDIITLLEQMTGATLPEEWDKRIKSWGNHYGNSKMAHVRLLRLSRSGALDELRRADSRLHRWLRPLPGSDDLAVVNDLNWNEAVEVLVTFGVEVEEGRWW